MAIRIILRNKEEAEVDERSFLRSRVLKEVRMGCHYFYEEDRRGEGAVVGHVAYYLLN